MTAVMDERLTACLAKRIFFQGGEVSPERLRTLVWMVLQRTASAEEIALHAYLRDEVVTAYLLAQDGKRLRQADLLQIFFAGKDASAAARELNLPERTGQHWVAEFCRFVPGELRRQADREKTVHAARAQCAESCGRRKLPAPSSESSGWTHAARTSKRPVFDNGRCPDCPLTLLGL